MHKTKLADSFLDDHDAQAVSGYHNWCGTFAITSFVCEQLLNNHASEDFQAKVLTLIQDCYPQIEIRNTEDLTKALRALSKNEQNLFVAYALLDATSNQLIKGKLPSESYDGILAEELKRYAKLLDFSLVHINRAAQNQDSPSMLEKIAMDIHASTAHTDGIGQTQLSSLILKIGQEYNYNSSKHMSIKQLLAKHNICITHEIGQNEQLFDDISSGRVKDTQTHFTRLYSNNYYANGPDDANNQYKFPDRHSNTCYLIGKIQQHTNISFSDNREIFHTLSKVRDIIHSKHNIELTNSFITLSKKIKDLTSETDEQTRTSERQDILALINHIDTQAEKLNFSGELYYLIHTLLKQLHNLITNIAANLPSHPALKSLSIFSHSQHTNNSPLQNLNDLIQKIQPPVYA